MTKDEIQSKTIDYLRFPLIILVVIIHSNLKNLIIDGVDLSPSLDNHLYYTMNELISEIIARIAVPLFFFISGFLFFYKVEEFNASTYFSKLSKRSRTILIPYLFWNFAILLLYLLAEQFIPGLFSGRTKAVSNYSFMDWLYAFYDTKMINPDMTTSSPTNYPFWFLRDLFIVMLFTPAIHYIINKFKFWTVLVMGVLWFFDLWFDTVGFSSTAFFFFIYGATFSIMKINFITIMNKLFSLSTISYIIICIILLLTDNQWFSIYLFKLSIVVGLFSSINIVSYLIEKKRIKTNTFLSKSSFFIYAVHATPLVFLIKYTVSIVQPHSDISYFLIYIICPIIIILISIAAYKLLSTICPKITAIITGGRI